MKPRFVYVHGNDTMHWSFAWAAWLKAELEKLGFETYFETMPDSILARAEYWLPFLKDYARVGQNDVLIGWSSGAVAAMRYAEQNKVLGSILVAPCYTDLDDPMEKQSGYYATPWDWSKIKANQDKIALVWGTDDPYIPQTQFEFIAKQLSPTQIKLNNKQHFIEQATMSEITEYIKANYVEL